MLIRLLMDEEGQDLVEYTLLIALIVVMSAALIYNAHESMVRVANRTTNNLDAAHNAAIAGS